eukprot:Anaeramoba_flamelloidesa814291_180.p1 GENE.a814291_180~~a814291_180.p1  ORF type:complete len:378 (+),score=139.43 a814291_180:36-1169(+)
MEKSLPDLFEQGQKLCESIDKGGFEREELPDQINKCLSIFDKVGKLMRSNSVFSENETIKEIKTSSLKYLLVPYYIAEVQNRISTKRDIVIKNAYVLYNAFLRKCLSLEIMNKSDLLSYKTVKRKLKQQMKGYNEEEVEEEEKKKSKKTTNKLSGMNLYQQQSDQRNLMVERYKRDKLSKEKIAKFEKLIKKQEQNSNQGIEENELDEMVRDFVLARIDISIRKAIQSCESFLQELEILKFIKDQGGKEEVDKKLKKEREDFKKNKKSGQQIKMIHIPKTKIEKTKEIKEKMYQPFHRQPIISEWDYLQKELEEEGVISGYGEKEKKQLTEEEKIDKELKLDEDNEEEQDKKTYEKREWDEFKDDNPTGWGNRPGNI